MTERIINNNKEEQIIYNKKESGQSPGGKWTGLREIIIPPIKEKPSPKRHIIDIDALSEDLESLPG